MDAQAIVQQEIKTSQGSIDAQPVDPPPNRPGRFFVQVSPLAMVEQPAK